MADNDQVQVLDVTLDDEDEEFDINLDAFFVPVQEPIVHSNTTEYWNSQPEFIGEDAHIYVYTDYTDVEGNDSPGIKVGDGVTLLSELPFVSGDTTVLDEHIANTIIHVTAAEKESWDNKVDPEEGKGLSENDFTDALKEKLEGIEAGAEVNVQSDWTETDTTADSFIQHKPTIPSKTSDLVNDSGFITANEAPVQGVKGSAESSYRTGNVSISKADIGLGNVDNTSDADKPVSTATQTALGNKVDKVTGKGLSANDFTDTLKTKLDGIAAGAEVNVQPNWTESDNTSDAYIRNKPSIPSKTSDLTNDSGFITQSDVAVKGVKGDAETNYRSGNVNITKANIGLANVDNTSDADKPISTATQAALNSKITNPSGGIAGQVLKKTETGVEWANGGGSGEGSVSSVNDVLPDALGNVSLGADDIPLGSGTVESAINTKANEDVIASVEATTTATARHEIGSYILLNSNHRLYRATDTITAGQTISTSTNVARVTIGEELSNIGNRVSGTASVAAGDTLATSWQTAGTVQITAGTWILFGALTFSGSNSAVTVGFYVDSRTNRSSVNALPSGNASASVSHPCTVTSTTTITFQAYGINSPKVVSPGVVIYALRIR